MQIIKSSFRWPGIAVPVSCLLLMTFAATRFPAERDFRVYGDEKAASLESETTATSKFAFAMLDLQEGYIAIRWDRQTGEAWMNFLNSDQWIPVKQADPHQRGRYEVKFSSWKKENTLYFIALKLDSESGKTWHFNNGTWLLIKEPPAN